MQPDALIHAGRRFRVVRRRHEGLGAPLEGEVILHPGAAVILPLLPDDRIVFIRNFRLALGRELLELPAGTIDPPEPAERTAARELEEETGYRAGRLEPLAAFYTMPGLCDELMHAFVASELVAGAPRTEANERIRVEILTRSTALDAARRGDIRDGKSLVTLLLFEQSRAAGGAAYGPA
jgi:ADP-ribose pyrophosphatase